MKWLAYAIGAFYVAGGALAVWAGRTSLFLDRATAQIGGQRTPLKERVRSLYGIVVGALTLASGAALVFLSRWAVAAFLTCAALQAAYLVWASRALPPADADEARGRRGGINALMIYAAVTALVIWLDGRGVLH